MRLIGRLVSSVAIATLVLATHGFARAEDPPDSVVVPLQLIDIGNGETKIGIELSLGGGEPKLYELDTGAAGFYAAYNAAWWPSFDVVDDQHFTQTYGSQIEYEARKVSTLLSIPNPANVDLHATVDIAQILDGWGGPLGPRDQSPYKHDVADDVPPIWGAFFGDFGNDLHEGESGLFAVLPQLPGNLSSGFIVSLGCDREPPALTIGLTDRERVRFSALVPMQPAKDGAVFPGSGYPTHDQKLVRGDFSLSLESEKSTFEAGVILDTGSPSAHIHDDDKTMHISDSLLDEHHGDDWHVLPEVEFDLRAAGIAGADDWNLSFLAGDVPGYDKVEVHKKAEKGDVNIGLNAFNQFDVMFDVAEGVVGFAACEDRPSMPGFRLNGIDRSGDALPDVRPAGGIP